jgi:hypothetical protein
VTSRWWVGLLATVLVAACSSAGSSTPGSSGVAVPATQAAVASPSPKVVVRIYPYELPWPEDELERKWRYASVPWDGKTRIDHGNAATDSVTTRDGDLFAFGHHMSGTAADLQAQSARNATEWHGCDADPIDEAPLPAGGEAGILAVHDCGDARVIRWFAVHDGFGLMVALIVAQDAEYEVARAHFEERVAKLTWTE